MARRDLGLAGLAAAELAAFFEKPRPSRAMDRAVDTAAPEERAIGGIDDGVNIELGDVADDGFDTIPKAHRREFYSGAARVALRYLGRSVRVAMPRCDPNDAANNAAKCRIVVHPANSPDVVDVVPAQSPRPDPARHGFLKFERAGDQRLVRDGRRPG